MKKTIFIVLVLCTTFSLKAKAEDPYLKLKDSILLSMKQLIINDLSEKNIVVYEGSNLWLGISYELKVIFNEKYLHAMSSFRRPYPLSKKSDKFKIFNESIFNNFMSYIYKYKMFPYDTFECLEYNFISGLNDGKSPPSSALYGKYKFKITSGSIYIIDSHIEILNDDESILKKYKSIW